VEGNRSTWKRVKGTGQSNDIVAAPTERDYQRGVSDTPLRVRPVLVITPPPAAALDGAEGIVLAYAPQPKQQKKGQREENVDTIDDGPREVPVASASAPPSSPFNALSNDLLKALLGYVDAFKTIGSAACTSKQLNLICTRLLRSPTFLLKMQPVLATHAIMLKDGQALLPEPWDASADPGKYMVRMCTRTQLICS
jgi:hypothetical protein